MINVPLRMWYLLVDVSGGEDRLNLFPNNTHCKTEVGEVASLGIVHHFGVEVQAQIHGVKEMEQCVQLGAFRVSRQDGSEDGNLSFEYRLILCWFFIKASPGPADRLWFKNFVYDRLKLGFISDNVGACLAIGILEVTSCKRARRNVNVS